MTFKTLDPATLVAAQIGADDIADAVAAGVTVVINNRPDGEDAGQPTGAEIEAAATAAGLRYVAIPVTQGFSHPQIDAMADAIEGQPKVLAYCRSGTRSTNLWALARARLGDDPSTLIEKAAGAGYDIRPLGPMLDMLAAK